MTKKKELSDEDYINCAGCNDIIVRFDANYCAFCDEKVCKTCRIDKYYDLDEFEGYGSDEDNHSDIFKKPDDYWCYSCNNIKENKDRLHKINMYLENILCLSQGDNSHQIKKNVIHLTKLIK